MAKLSDMSADDRRRSARLHTVWRPLGVDQELRLMFLADGACWGAAGLVRTGADFTDRETDYLAAVAPALAERADVGEPLPSGDRAVWHGLSPQRNMWLTPQVVLA